MNEYDELLIRLDRTVAQDAAGFHSRSSDLKVAATAIRALLKRVSALEYALSAHGEHRPRCAAMEIGPDIRKPCDCGLGSALSAAQPKEAERGR